MKKAIVSIIMLTALLLLAACGTNTANNGSNHDGGHGSTPVQGTPNGEKKDVQVVLGDFSIKSSETTFKAGVTYTFHVKNEGKVEHEFMIMPKSGGPKDGAEHDHNTGAGMLASVTGIAPGQTKTLTYTFTDQYEQPELACFITGHYEAGMKESGLVIK